MIEVPMILGGLIVGIVVGMTGMGGGALMTPMLIFVFKVDPLAAVSSDVVASFFMKPAGAFVHLRRGTVNLKLVGWLCLGSVPAAFSGALLIRVLPFQDDLDAVLKTVLGVALILAASGLVARAYINLRKSHSLAGEGPASASRAEVRIKPVPTVLLGAVAGLMVGMTSVGAGSVIIVILLMMYPALKASQLVGTDLVQAVPLVAAASVGHLLYGDFHAGVTLSLLLGAVPGAWFGAQISSRAPGGLIRRALAILLLASGMKLLGASYTVMAVGAGFAIVGGTIGWEVAKSRVRSAADRAGAEAAGGRPAEEASMTSRTRSPDDDHQGPHP